MGYIRRRRSGKVLNGSKMVVPGQGVSTINPGGDSKLNKQPNNQSNSRNT
jgi:hypothetical protein